MLKKLRSFFKHTPTRGYFSAPLNVAGSQVIRTTYYYMAFSLRRILKGRPKPPNNYAEILERDGEADGNSLVIFNTMGLHRRGRFSKAGERHAILIDFRYMDSLLNLIPRRKKA